LEGYLGIQLATICDGDRRNDAANLPALARPTEQLILTGKFYSGRLVKSDGSSQRKEEEKKYHLPVSGRLCETE
jgi:hypothetical protein